MLTTTLEALDSAPVISVIRAPDRDSALRGVAALARGGIRGIEITYSTPDAAGIISELLEEYGDTLVIGAGTVRTVEQATEASDAGAAFLVSPGTFEPVVSAIVATGKVAFLGALTPSEIMRALHHSADVIKLFPASLGGPDFLKSLRGPFPDVTFCPTGGVNPDNIGDWLAAGATLLGAGSELCSSAHLTTGDWGGIESRARAFVAATRL